ncbi:MAG TPA: hypothetical protein PLL30_06110 [Candidatus Krumholzibacteria bacterium]|nr:hypothetical protein [Candidatus Krumholzibacteria bacterium]HPD71339.1 hypothetical protein [Candidatus Krumholzibacteria bacterium]HRY38961.1 hypothetical protein [Candidatus Krumholzibacteria bacterium]
MPRPDSPSLRRAAAVTSALALGGLILGGCEIADPELPRFTTQLALPLGEERLAIADLVDDEDYLIELADGTLGFHVAGDPDTVRFDFDLGADLAAQTFGGDLGPFALDVAPPGDFAFPLVQLLPAAADLDGQLVGVPPFDFSSDSEAEDLDGVESATLASGSVAVTVANGLPVDVCGPGGGDRLALELVNPGDGAVLVRLEFPPIAAGGQAQQAADLAGVTLAGAVAVRVAGGSPGTNGALVVVDAQAAITVAVTFSGLCVTQAEATVPAQAFTDSFTTALPADYAVYHAVIASGEVSFTLTNEMAIPCQATVAWPDVRDLDDQPAGLTVDLAGCGTATGSVDFAGYTVLAPTDEPLRALVATLAVTSPGSGGAAVVLAADQGVDADLAGGRLEFSSVGGLVPAVHHEFAPLVEAVDLPEELAGMEFVRASLVLALTNSACLSANADLELVGVNAAGDARSLRVEQPIAAAGLDRATTTRIVLDETNSDLVAFLSNLPTAITLTGGVDLGGPDQVGTVHADDYAVLDWEITSPVEVVIGSSLLYGDPSGLDLDEDARDLIRDRAGAAEVRLAVVNHLPVGVTVRLLLGTDPATLATAPLLAIGPIAVAAPAVDPATHVVIEPLASEPRVSLTAAETRVFATENLTSRLEVALPSTGGDPVRVMTSDYLTVQGLIRLDVEVSDDDD